MSYKQISSDEFFDQKSILEKMGAELQKYCDITCMFPDEFFHILYDEDFLSTVSTLESDYCETRIYELMDYGSLARAMTMVIQSGSEREQYLKMYFSKRDFAGEIIRNEFDNFNKNCELLEKVVKEAQSKQLLSSLLSDLENSLRRYKNSLEHLQKASHLLEEANQQLVV